MEQSQNEANLSSEEIARYARHISLPEIGINGSTYKQCPLSLANQAPP